MLAAAPEEPTLAAMSPLTESRSSASRRKKKVSSLVRAPLPSLEGPVSEPQKRMATLQEPLEQVLPSEVQVFLPV